MPTIKRTTPHTHKVVVDTNILWDKDKKLPATKSFDNFWQKNSTLIPMKLYVPEVVLGELHFQQTTSAIKALSVITENYSELSGITDAQYIHKCNETTIKTQVKSKLDKWLKSNTGAILTTPTDSINWSNLVESAIWRIPPFSFDPKDAKNEKGFRDAIILETVAYACNKLSDDELLIFICNDHQLRTAAENRLKSSSKFLAFESTDDFGSYINLTQQKFTTAFVEGIQHHARTKFYVKGKDDAIYYKYDISKRILTEHSDILNHQQSAYDKLSSAIVSINKLNISPSLIKQIFLIGSTQFRSAINTKEFHWISHIDVARLYELEQQGGLILSVIPQGRKIRVVGFDIVWKANVKSDGRFHNIDVLEIQQREVQVLDATDENLQRWRVS